VAHGTPIARERCIERHVEARECAIAAAYEQQIIVGDYLTPTPACTLHIPRRVMNNPSRIEQTRGEWREREREREREKNARISRNEQQHCRAATRSLAIRYQDSRKISRVIVVACNYSAIRAHERL